MRHPNPLLSSLHRLGLVLLACVALAGCDEEEYRLRKNVKNLSAQERQDYVAAVLKLKQTPSPHDSRYSWYDQFVVFHKQVVELGKQHDGEHPTVHQGHTNPTFLPWHRKMLLLYEDALREVSGKDITLPYWDWTDPESTAAVFAEDFMGPGGVKEQDYAVLSGPFRKGVWTLNVLPDPARWSEKAPYTHLVRGLGDDSGNFKDGTREIQYRFSLPTLADVETCLSIPEYDPAGDKDSWTRLVPKLKSFRNCLEGFGGRLADGTEDPGQYMHNIVHDWVAGIFQRPDGRVLVGTMEPLETSPNDPIFFLHHANVDRIWALWEQRHGSTYTPGSGGPAGSNRDDPLLPFQQYADDPRMKAHGLTSGSMLDTSSLSYAYE
jgi:tyrosinase